MSLLLEALKKAELAKQIAKAEAASPEPKPAPSEPTKPVMTRERLPDITQPLEILSDDLPSSETKAAEPAAARRSEEHTSELQSPDHLVSRLLLEKKNTHYISP